MFLTNYLKRVHYLQRVDQDSFHDVLFNFKQETCDRDTYIFKERELSTGVFIVKNGIIEISVKVEGQELAIERLYRGSVINHNAFLIHDICDVSGRCIDTMTMFYLTYEDMERIKTRHADLSLDVEMVRKSY